MMILDSLVYLGIVGLFVALMMVIGLFLWYDVYGPCNAYLGQPVTVRFSRGMKSGNEIYYS